LGGFASRPSFSKALAPSAVSQYDPRLDGEPRGVFQVKKIFSVVALAVLLFMAIPAQAQIQSNQASVNLSMTISESLTISATPANISFTYNPASGGTATASGPITVVTSANLASGHTILQVFGWLSSTTAALSGPSNIPSSEVFANTTGNGQYANGGNVPCTGESEGAGALGVDGAQCGSVLGTQDMLDGTRAIAAGGAFTVNDSVVLSLANLGPLAAGSYAGTINFEAQVL